MADFDQFPGHRLEAGGGNAEAKLLIHISHTAENTGLYTDYQNRPTEGHLSLNIVSLTQCYVAQYSMQERTWFFCPFWILFWHLYGHTVP